jgi:uracil-DNA glycosylase family 4
VKESRKLVMGNGSKTSHIMIIGEAPGANEDAKGEPFVGQAGQILNEALAKAGVPRPAVYVTNIYKHRPPNNRPPTWDEMNEHKSLLIEEFEAVRPKSVLLLGNTSLKFFTGKANIGQRHGTRIFPPKETHMLDIPLEIWQHVVDSFWYCTYHPAATLYNRNTRKDFLNDVKNFCDIARKA